MKPINKRTRELEQSVEAYSCSCECLVVCTMMCPCNCTSIATHANGTGSNGGGETTTNFSNPHSSISQSVAQQSGSCQSIWT